MDPTFGEDLWRVWGGDGVDAAGPVPAGGDLEGLLVDDDDLVVAPRCTNSAEGAAPPSAPSLEGLALPPPISFAEERPRYDWRESLNLIAGGRQVSLPRVYELMTLVASAEGPPELLERLCVRPTASPFPAMAPGVDDAYYFVVGGKRSAAERAAAKGGGGGGGGGDDVVMVSVSFQSVLNSEVWWATPARGVASRPMSRTSRGGRGDVHGYKGRLYTMVTGDPAKGCAKRVRQGAAVVRAERRDVKSDANFPVGLV